jgi:hypothetical protein
MIVKGQLLGQHEDLLARPPGVFLLHPQVGVDALIVTEKAARIRIEPPPEVVQRIGFHRHSDFQTGHETESGKSTGNGRE